MAKRMMLDGVEKLVEEIWVTVGGQRQKVLREVNDAETEAFVQGCIRTEQIRREIGTPPTKKGNSNPGYKLLNYRRTEVEKFGSALRFFGDRPKTAPQKKHSIIKST